MNSINVIAPYRYLGMWVFDDARAGLVQQPFVGGADTMIGRVVADIPGCEERIRHGVLRRAVCRPSVQA